MYWNSSQQVYVLKIILMQKPHQDDWPHCWWGMLLVLLQGDLLWYLEEENSACTGSLTRKAADDNDRLLLRPGLLLEFWISDTCFRDLEKNPLGLWKLLSAMLPTSLPSSDGFSQYSCLSVDNGGDLLFPLLEAEDLKKKSFFMCVSSAENANCGTLNFCTRWDLSEPIIVQKQKTQAFH